MGFSTNITLQNDFWHEVQKEPKKLIKAIASLMNDGSESDPLRQVWNLRDYGQTRFVDQDEYVRWARSNYVSVHKAQHNDTPQVIVNTYRNHAIAAHEIPQAIGQGWLALNPYNARHAEEVAQELEQLAKDIRKQLEGKS